MSCSIYQSPMFHTFENRLRSDSSYSASCSTEQLIFDNLKSQNKQLPSTKQSKLIPNIILTNISASKPSSVNCGFQLHVQQPQKRVQDEQMDNLNTFFTILTQIHQQQSFDQQKKEESALVERKRELRRLKIQRYREKKQTRKWDVLRYEVRKNIAKSRLRIKGRFVRE